MLDYNISKRYYMMIAIDLSKQQALGAYAKDIQEFHFTENLEIDREWNREMFFIIEEAKETVLEFSQKTVKVF